MKGAHPSDLETAVLAHSYRRVGPLSTSDGTTVADDGTVCVAQNLGGRVIRIDPETGWSA